MTRKDSGGERLVLSATLRGTRAEISDRLYRIAVALQDGYECGAGWELLGPEGSES